jgi:hypothetical protein
MSGPKIVILVLVILVVIFAVTIGVGSWPGRDPKYDKNSGWVNMLDNAFPPKYLDQERIVSTCLDEGEGVFTIPENQRWCIVIIKKGDERICNLKLELTKGGAMLTYEPTDDDGLPIKNRDLRDVKEGESFTLQISKEGGRLTLTKVGSSSCEIKIRK